MLISYSVRFDPLPDFDCEIEASLEWRMGEPGVVIDDVLMDGVSLFHHPDAMRHAMFLQIATAIADRAEDDDFILTQLLEADGVSFVGGANNPDAHYARAV